jgi:ankyrin repeat protein
MAEGSVRFEHGDWTAVDAIAYTDGDEIEVVFSDSAFDREAIAEDGVVNSFDAIRHSGNTLTVNVGLDGPTMCMDFMNRLDDTMYSGSSCRSEFMDAIEIELHNEERIAGRVNWGETDGEHIHLQFDVEILGGADGGMLGGPGDPLPEDGGEPGKAVLLHYELLEAGDWDQLKASSHPEGRAMMEESEAAGEHLELFEMLRIFSPQDVRITGGTVSGDTAYVTFEAEEDGASVTGIATVIRFEDQWYYRGSSTEVTGGGSAYIPEASGGYTSLMMAIVMGQTEAVSILLQDAPDLSALTPEGKTVATLAAESGNPEIVAALLDAGADFMSVDESGSTPALSAVRGMGGSEDIHAIIEMLGLHGADLNQGNEYHTPLFYAVDTGDARLVEALLMAGADPSAPAADGRLPVVTAIWNIDILRHLLDAGADPDTLDSYGDPLLFLALRDRSREAMEALLTAGADANLRDSAGRSALEYARDMYMDDEIALLMSHGAVDEASSEASAVEAEAAVSPSAEVSGAVAMPPIPPSLSVPNLPRYAGSTVLFEQDAIGIFLTADAVARVAEETMSLLQSAGWQGRLTAETPDMKHLTFDLDAVELSVMVSVAPAQGNQTAIQYSLQVK